MSEGSLCQEEYIEQLRKSYHQLTNEFMKLSEQKTLCEEKLKADSIRSEEKITEQRNVFTETIENLQRKISDLEDHISKIQSEENHSYRKEVRKYIQNLNDKEIEINSLKRQINNMKNKINSLEQEVNNLTNSKQNYQMFVLKAIEQVKSSFKETNNFLDDIDNQKMVMTSKYRQLSDKTLLLQNQFVQIQGQKYALQESYSNLQYFYKLSKEQSLQLKYEVEKYKAIGQEPLAQSRFLQTSKVQNFQRDIQNILQLKTIINSCQTYLVQTNNFAQLNESLISENKDLKTKISNLEYQIEQMNIKYKEGYRDSLLKDKEPCLYDFLIKKRDQIFNLQQSIDKIEAYVEENDEKINSIINNMLLKQKQCSCGKGEQIQHLKLQIGDSLKRVDVLTESNQKIRKQLREKQQKMIKYVEQIRQLLDTKKNKKKKKRCRYCLLGFDKNTETCPDCNKIYHSGECVINHVCDAFSLEDRTSSFSGIGE